MEHLSLIFGIIVLVILVPVIVRVVKVYESSNQCKQCGKEVELEKCLGCGKLICIDCQYDDLYKACLHKMNIC